MKKLTAIMSRSFEALLLLVAAALFCCAGAAAADNKLEAIGAFTDPGASDALKISLESKGSRISVSGAAYCDVWLRSGAPSGKTDAMGAVYTWIGDSTLIGVITFANATTDFRGQSIKSGSYTMRYAVHPTDGNHMGISPIRDFLVLLPIAADSNPDAQFKFEELTRMSTKVTGTSHPAVLSLIQLTGAPPAPKLDVDENNHIAFSAAIKTKSGEAMPISVVVKGHAEQ